MRNLSSKRERLHYTCGILWTLLWHIRYRVCLYCSSVRWSNLSYRDSTFSIAESLNSLNKFSLISLLVWISGRATFRQKAKISTLPLCLPGNYHLWPLILTNQHSSFRNWILAAQWQNSHKILNFLCYEVWRLIFTSWRMDLYM